MIKYLVLCLYNISVFTVSAQYTAGAFDKEYINDLEEIEGLLNSNDSWSNYKLAQYVDMNNNMFDATDNVKYLNESIRIILRVIQNSTFSSNFNNSQFKDRFRGWVNKSHPELKNDGKEYSLYESFFWRYATNTLVLIRKKQLQSHYRTNFNMIWEFSSYHVFEKWFARGRNNIYRHATNLFAQWAHISLNLWILSNNKKYYMVFESFNNQFLKSIIKSGNKKHWKLELNGAIQDVSHANSEVSYFVQAYENNIERSSEGIGLLIELLENQIIKKNNEVCYYVNGTGKTLRDNRWLIDGFLKLGRYDQDLNVKLRNIPVLKQSDKYYRRSHAISVLILNEKKLL